MSQRYLQSIKPTGQSNEDSVGQGNTSLLSPHNSVFQALNNPELGNLDISRINSRNVCDSPDLNVHGQQQFNEFASWHLVQQNSNSSSYNNLSGPSSILSSSDAEDNQIFINSYIEHPRPQQQQQQQHPLKQRVDLFSYLDTGLPSSEDEEFRTELDDNNSTIHQVEKLQMPSFIMPKVSIIEDENDVDKLKVNIIGEGSSHLIERLNLYNKILQNVNFNNINPDLIILVIDQNNLLLSQQLSKPFIPVFISNDESSIYEQDLNSTMMTSMSSKICQPIRLKSLDDDLFLLINLLSNIDIKLLYDKKSSSTTIIKRPNNNNNGKKSIKKSKRSKKIPNRLVDVIYQLIHKNASKLLLSVGYLGLCYYGISIVLSKRKSISAQPAATTAAASIIRERNENLVEAYIAQQHNDDEYEISRSSARIFLKGLEQLVDNLIERGRLTGYWLYYNVLIMWE